MADATPLPQPPRALDVAIVGSGFAGLYLLHKLRGLGIAAFVFEGAGGVGGTWYWNRYPGARCDVESMQYSFSFDEALQQEWQWSERFASQPEILTYANHIADRYKLRDGIKLNTRVTGAEYDAGAARWTVRTDQGDVVSAQHLVMATGCLSTARVPDFKGLSSFKGATYHTGYWPHEPVDFTGKRVAVIGTGSSAIQAIPVIAEQAADLTVFQRTPNFSIPSRNGPMDDAYEQSWKTGYAQKREEAKLTKAGILNRLNDVSGLSLSEAERIAVFKERWASGGTSFMGSFNDMVTSQEVNDSAADFVRAQIRKTVHDPKVADLLCPTNHPIGTKRICVDTNYFQTYNRPNVTLVNVRGAPITEITPTGLRWEQGEVEVDAIVFATGFDAMTGTITRLDITGRDGRKIADEWAGGPRTYLGLMSEGFPNLHMVTGPGSPSVLSNMIVSIEQHVEWLVDLFTAMRARHLTAIEPTAEAQEDWVEHVNVVAHKTLYPQANSWYMGANIPGKKQVFMPYIGGVDAYRLKCDAVTAAGYEGFRLEELAQARAAE